MVAIVGLLILLMPWMLRTLVEFATAMIEKMPQMVQVTRRRMIANSPTG